jgi:beta-N-acetylhexosaminidase
MGLVYGALTVAAFVQMLLAALSFAPEPRDEIASLTPREKAALVVVSGLPAPDGVAGVLVQAPTRAAQRSPGALVFVDQEGGDVRAFSELPPVQPAAAYPSAKEALLAGLATGRALRRKGVDVNLAPVLDAPSGPLGRRHFRRARLALAFARGLRRGGIASCAKHFPGLGTAAASTDEQPRVQARVTAGELAAFRRAIAQGVPCVMTSHAIYRRFGDRRAILAPEAHRMLRRMGFQGVIVTDSLSIVRDPAVGAGWARRAMRAGADLVLFTSPAHARRAIAALLPLARAGELDEHVRRVLEFRRLVRSRNG